MSKKDFKDIVLDFDSVKDINDNTISKEYILSRVSEIQIIEYYLKIDLSNTKKILSPFRDEKNPSFTFKISNSSVIAKDWGTGDSYDCFAIVQKLYNCNFFEALKIISNDFNLSSFKVEVNKKLLINQKDIIENKFLIDYNKRIISIEPQPYTFSDIKYWSKFGISIQTLTMFDVISCKRVWYNGNLIKVYNELNPIYAYKFVNYKVNKYKIYQPLTKDKNKKWLFNGSSNDIEGFDQLPLFGDLLIITKSMKDVMCLYELGYNSISLQGESNTVTESLYNKLCRRFTRIVSLYDYDYTGIKGADKMFNSFGIEKIFIPEETNSKDISKYYENYGRENSLLLLDTLLNN